MNYIYDKITHLIIQKLENGVIPWRKTWATSMPKNFVSGLEYKGINPLLLGLENYESHFWLTFKQCKDIGGSIKKGESASTVVFWKPIVKITETDADENTADVKFLLRWYSVFNIAQCNLPDEVIQKKTSASTNANIEKIEAEQLIRQYRNPPVININNTIPNPRYLPFHDRIDIPSLANFHRSNDYYAALFHELVHSTGAKHRLSRHGITSNTKFDSEVYSKEELIAEIGASFLCNMSGITQTIDNHSSYIHNWLQVLKNDSRMILIAASQAQKACDYIMNESSEGGNE